jgi:hypothetical protein
MVSSSAFNASFGEITGVPPDMEIRMRSNVCTLILAAASLAPSALLAEPLDPAADGATIVATAPRKGVVARAEQITTSVEAVDSANRTVTLKAPGGGIVTLPVGPEVRNFDQIRVGDLVVVRYLEGLTLELKKRGTAQRERTDRDLTQRAQPGERPARLDAHEVHVIADVIAVDPLTRTVRLRGPTRVVDLRVYDPEQFKLVAVGDQVEATYTEAVAISVEPAGAPQ